MKIMAEEVSPKKLFSEEDGRSAENILASLKIIRFLEETIILELQYFFIKLYCSKYSLSSR